MCEPKREDYDLSDPKQRMEYWNLLAAHKLQGKIIEEARYIPDEDFGMVFAITLSDENVMFVLGDDEGNHAGSLSFNDGSCLPTL